jgi:hypothetical protein
VVIVVILVVLVVLIIVPIAFIVVGACIVAICTRSVLNVDIVVFLPLSQILFDCCVGNVIIAATRPSALSS